MSSVVPIKVLKSIEMIYDLFNYPFNDFKLFSTTKSVNFDEKLIFVKQITEQDVSDIEVFTQKRIFLVKILKEILKEIDSPHFISIQKSPFDLLVDYQEQLRNLIIKYDVSENNVLLHYSQFTTYSRDWNNLTKFSRGLIIDLDAYKVVAHPYDKFHNYLEIPATQEENLPDLPYEVATKLDGSEGILYPLKNGTIKIITKGSFESEQGVFATELLWSKYHKQANIIIDRRLYNNYTLTFEILYSHDDPNRIVVAYDEPDLRLIGVKDLNTSQDLSYSEVIAMAKELGFPHTELEKITLEEIKVERKTRENFEGWVVHFENGLRMKIKCDPYLELHGARFGSTVRAIWHILFEGRWDDFISSVPQDMKAIPENIYNRIIEYARDYRKDLHSIYNSLPKIESDKEFALYVNKNVEKEFKSYMFTIRQGAEIEMFRVRWTTFREKYYRWEEEKYGEHADFGE